METHWRSIAKAVIWRILGIFILGGLSWAFTKSWEDTSVITISFNSIRLVLYYFHERAWDRVSWGRKKVKEDYTI